MELKAYLATHPTKENSTHWITECPNQGCPGRAKGKAKYYIKKGDRPLGYCFHCGYKGQIDGTEGTLNEGAREYTSIKDEEWINECHSLLMEDRQGRNIGLHYLTNERGFTTQTIKNARLGFDPTSGCITIPSFFEDRLYSIKGRIINPSEDQPKYIYLKGKPIYPYGWDAVGSEPVDPSHLILCEGEFDSLAAKELLNNTNVVAVCGATIFKPNWLKMFRPFDRIYLRYDLDADDKVYEYIKQLGDYRCFIVRVPKDVKDINDLLKKYPRPEATRLWKEAIHTAKLVGRPLLASVQDYAAKSIEYFESRESKGVSTGYEALDRITGKINAGGVYLLVGPQKRGKTTIALSIMLNIARQDKMVMIGSFEMSPEREILPRTVGIITKHNLELEKNAAARIKDGIETTTLNNKYRDSIQKLAEWGKLLFVNRHDRIRIREIEEAVRIGYREGSRFLLLDHAQFIMDFGTEEVFKATAKISRLIKRLTNDYPDLAILLISEMAGYEPKGNSHFKNDTRHTMGGNTLEYDVNQVWWMGPPFCEEGELVVKAARDASVKAGGLVKIYFNDATLQYEMV